MRIYKTAILDISSDTVKVFVGEKSDSGIFSIKSNTSCKYDGYIGDDWGHASSLKTAIKNAIISAQDKAKCKIKKVYVGVGAEFCAVRVCDVTNVYENEKKLNQYDIDTLFEKGMNFSFDEAMTVITQSVLYYSIDDGKFVYNPLGALASKISAKISYLMCETKIISLVDGILNAIGITQNAYVCTAFAQTQSLFDAEARDKSMLLCEIGENYSFVAIARGTGLLELASFGLGRRDFLEDLMGVLLIDEVSTERLLSQININFSHQNYKLNIGGEEQVYYTQNIDDIVLFRIKSISKTIQKCLASFDYQCPIHMCINITGAGCLAIKGFKEAITKELGRRVEIIAPNVPGFGSPKDSSVMGLFDEAIKTENIKTGIFSKFLRKLGGK